TRRRRSSMRTSSCGMAGAAMLVAGQPRAKVRRQRIPEHLFDGPRRVLRRGPVAPAARPAEPDPVGGAVARPTKARRINKGLEPVDRMAVDLLPVGGEARRHPTEQMRG